MSSSQSGRLAGKIAIITGSSSGLGRAIALLYAQEGASVVCADLRPSARKEVPNELEINTDELIRQQGGKAIFVRTDVGDAKDMEAVVTQAVEEYGRLDIMVNNAGISIEAADPQPIHLVSEHTWDLTMRVNVKSVFLGCKYAVAQMLKQDILSCGSRGWIINLSSIYGLVSIENIVSYSASKGAVSNLTRAVALDCSRQNIHCNAICPGHIQTAIFAETTSNYCTREEMNKMYPFKGPGKPSDIAKMAVVLASNDANWMTGACVSVDGGYTAR